VTEREALEQAITQLQAQRATLGDAVVDASVAALREKLATLEPLPPSDQRKQVTVLFADASGYMAMAETLDAEEVSEVMNALWQRVDAVIVEHGGRIDKHFGDGVMALWGADAARESDPERAIRAALAIQAAASEVEAGHSLRMRIGLSTGPVLLGTVDTTGEFFAIGDTVNLASRLEEAAPTGGVLISHDTYRHVRGLFDVLEQEPLLVKGKAEPVQTYVVQRARARAFHLGRRGIQGIETRMIGRDGELAALQDLLDRAIAGRRTTLVTVLGEAGLGKSRLLYEFEDWLALRPGEVTCFKGRCTQQRQGVANGLLRDLFAFRFGIAESGAIELAREKLEAGVAEFLPEDGETKAHYLGAWLGYDYGHSAHVAALRGDAEQLRNRASLYLGQYLAALAAHSPVVILVEDLHWADGGSLDALVDLCRRQPGLPLFILSVARPGLLVRRPGWGSDLLATHYRRIDLSPLAEAEGRALVAEILQKVNQVPSILVELLVSRAEGNPYYIEELAQMLIDQGVVFTGEGSWRVVVEKLAEWQVPPTLTAVLQARLDRLSPPQKKVLQQAAVVGRVFWDAVLVELGSGAEVHLAELVRRELVLPQRESAFAGAAEHIFKHALLRDVTYETVLKRVRRTTHRLVGAWLVAAAEANGRTDEYAAVIGEHYERAGEIAAARAWYGRAGQRAAGQFDQEAAINWLSRALELTPVDDWAARYELLMAREGVYHLLGQREEQETDLDRLAELAGETKDAPPVWGAQVLIRQAVYAEAASDYPAAVTAAEGALARAEAVADGRLAAAALACWGHALRRQGEFTMAQSRHAAGLAQAEAAGAQAELADNLRGLGLVAYAQGDYVAAQEHFEAALAIAREIGDRLEESRCFSNLGTVAYAQGDYAGARGFYEASLTIVREIGDRLGASLCLSGLASVAYGQGDYIEARRYCERSLAIAREIGDRQRESACLSNLGVVAKKQGDYVAARRYYQASLETKQEIGDRPGEGICLSNLGVVARDQGDYAAARGYYESALEIYQQTGDRRGEGTVLHNLGALARAEGELAEAEGCFRQARALREELGQQQHMVEDQAELAGLALARGEPAKAREALEPVLTYLAEHANLEGAAYSYRVFLLCGRILRAVGDVIQAREIVDAGHTQLVRLAEELPTPAQREQFWQARDYAALRRLWVELDEGVPG
jgi:predicted ATPase/class 3 adenylate cyclase